MTWGTVTIGGIAFREELSVEQASDGSLRLAGQESRPPSSAAAVMAAHRNVLGLDEQTVPVVFSDKAELTGFYRVSGAQSTLYRFANGAVQSATWSATLERVGSARDVEFESRVPTIARTDTIAGTQTPSFWHAPPVGFTSYYTGATVPTGSVARASADGTLTAYTGLPNAVAPRWTVAAEDYLKGSARLLFDDFRHVGTTTPTFTTWELSNGLLRVTQDAAGISVAAWGGVAWESAKGYRFTVNGVAVTGSPDVTVLRCDPEECRLRLSWAIAPGRVTVDLSLRRGSRFVTGVIKRHAAAALGVVRSAAEAATVATGGLAATSADSDGDRFVMGSSRAITTATGTASISEASVTAFDFFLGHEFGSSPATGDAFADLLSQYLGTASDRTRVVRR